MALETQSAHYRSSTESVYGGYIVVTVGLDTQSSLSLFERSGTAQRRGRRPVLKWVTEP